MAYGLFFLRAVVGLTLFAHGAQKLFGWFGGHGLNGTAGFFEQLGFRPGRLFAVTAAATELTSGVLLALGLLSPIASALMISVMVVAMGSVHWKNGLFAATNGIEVPFLYAVGALALGFTGPGAFSLDAVLGLTALWTPALVAVILGLGVVGGFANLALRRPAAVTA